MWEQRTKHFYLNPRQLNEPANSMGKIGFKGPPSSWGAFSQSELIRCQRRSRYRFRNRCLQSKPKGAHGCSAAENPRENTLLNPSSESLLPSFWPWFLLPALQEHKLMALVKGQRRKRLLLLVRKVDDQTWLLPSKDRNSSSSVTQTGGRGRRETHPVGNSVLLTMDQAKSYKVRFVKP